MAIPEWIHLSKTTGASEVFTNITISADTNTGTTSRSYTLTVTGGTPGDIASATIEVTQEGMPDYNAKYLTFNITTGGTINWRQMNQDRATSLGIEYRINEGTWRYITSSCPGTSFNVHAGDVVEFRGNKPSYVPNIPDSGKTPATYVTYANSFCGTTASFTVEGNIMSLVNETTFSSMTRFSSGIYNLAGLFYGCTGLTDASNLSLPATALTEGCYNGMFDNTRIRTSPRLPATVLAKNCYARMFYYSLLLETSPVLPATSLSENCYYLMFYNTRLTTPPALPATSLAKQCYYGMFNACTRLTTAPVLSATTLAEGCYNSMFGGCSSLTTAPVLPADTLAEECYLSMFKNCGSLTTPPPAISATTAPSNCCYSMFSGCASLTSTPILSPITLGTGCYSHMFFGCTSLTTAPTLPALSLGNLCYNMMFYGCTGLTSAPNLPATSLSKGCYAYMFLNCSSLTSVPSILPATTLTESCYEGMFQGCSSLTTAPELPATILTGYSYNNMFEGCSSLNYIKCLGIVRIYTACTEHWVSGVSETGTFIQHQFADWQLGPDDIPATWVVYREYDIMPMTFKIISGGTINWSHRRTLIDDVGDKTIEYRINDGNWTSITSSSAGSSFNVSTGDIVEFRGDNTQYGSLPLSYNTFSGTTATFEAYGNTMSLINSTGYTGVTDLTEQYAFNRLFAGCTGLTTAEYLVLPTTTLPMHVYSSMFEGCTSMTAGPELPAATLTNSCYNEMFSGCNSLSSIRCLATDISAYNCTYNWVSNVASSGIFTKAHSMTGWGSGNSGIPSGWSTRDA